MFDRVRSWLSGLLLGALFASGASAQGPWYVDGVSGVDAPGRGTTLATPWKTIGYAMAQASPATTGTNVVYVAGGQTYGAATNGETFPVVMRPGLALQGFSAGSSGLPVLQIPTGATGVEFTSTQNDQIVTNSVRGLTLSGGATGIAATSGASISHDSLVENCRFLGQQSQGVVLTALGLAQLSSVVRSCTFVGCGAGIEHGGWGMIGNTIVEDCVFQQMSRLGISTSGYFVAQGRVSGCRFEAGTIGVEVMGSALNLQFVVENSTFQMQSSTGVKLTTGLAGLNAIVRDSKFTGCRKGVEVLPGAPAQVDIQSNTFVECQEGSYCAYGGRSGVLDVYYEGNVFIGCGTGTTILGFVDASIKRDRFQGCQTGLNCLGGELPTVRIRASSASFVRNNVGLNLVWVYDSILDGLTIADNVAGLQSDVVYSVSPAYSGLSGFVQGSECRNSVFSGNGTDLRDLGSGQPPYVPGNTYGMIPLINFFFNCCFQGTNTVANGNLGLTDPLLSRPTYKLLPGSPCIDRVAPSATTPLYDFEGDPRVVVAGGSSATLLDIGADEFVPQGSARPYGTSGIGKGLLFPRISSPNSAVRYGTSLTLDLTGALSQLSGQAATSALLTFGWDDDSGVLPMDLGVFGLSGSLLWNDFVTTFPIQPVTAAGTASYTTAIPNNQALVGLTSTYQWFALMPGGDIVSSNGLRATIGQ